MHGGGLEGNSHIGVFIIADHQLFGQTVGALLRNQGGIILLGWAARREALEVACSLPVDVILIDATMEKMDAIQVILEIKEELPMVNVIMLGMDNDEEAILELIEAGMNGYLMKKAPFSELLNAIQAAHQAQTTCSRRITASVFARITKLSLEQSQYKTLQGGKLGPREQEVLWLIAAGLGNKEIAQRLYISLSTVKNHVHNILKKLQVHQRRDAIRSAYEKGLLRRARQD